MAGLPNVHAQGSAAALLADAVYRQFGADPAKATDPRTVDNFRTDCLRELKKIKTAGPGLQYRTAKGVLVVSPSPPRIQAAQLRLVE